MGEIVRMRAQGSFWDMRLGWDQRSKEKQVRLMLKEENLRFFVTEALSLKKLA
jgi:hypothetical protein